MYPRGQEPQRWGIQNPRFINRETISQIGLEHNYCATPPMHDVSLENASSSDENSNQSDGNEEICLINQDFECGAVGGAGITICCPLPDPSGGAIPKKKKENKAENQKEKKNEKKGILQTISEYIPPFNRFYMNFDEDGIRARFL